MLVKDGSLCSMGEQRASTWQSYIYSSKGLENLDLEPALHISIIRGQEAVS